MVRVIGILVGLASPSRRCSASALFGAYAADHRSRPRRPPSTSSTCIRKELRARRPTASFGKFDQQQLQRGFQVYKEVCSACHSLRLVAFRDLEGHRL